MVLIWRYLGSYINDLILIFVYLELIKINIQTYVNNDKLGIQEVSHRNIT